MSAARFQLGDRVRVLGDLAGDLSRFATVVAVDPSSTLPVMIQFDGHATRYGFEADDLVAVPWWSGIDELPSASD